MATGHLQAGDELCTEATVPAREARPWPAAVAAAAAVIAIVVALVLIPRLAGDGPAPAPTPVLPPVSTLPPGVVPWVAWPAPAVKKPTTAIRSRLSVLKVTLTFPGRVTLGIAVNYTVTLANPTRQAVVLRPCPSYSETLTGAATPVVFYYLNCGAATSIPAGRSVTFQMMTPVPVQAGKVRVVWQLQRTDVTAAARAVVLAGTPGGVVT
jgi:hypothetical protein